MEEEHMLTTIDNPFNPFTDYRAWDTWDRAAGYNTTSFIARITRMNDESSDLDQHQAFELAIDEAVKYNVTGVYRKITRNQKPLADSSLAEGS